jgi:hypothetical protein
MAPLSPDDLAEWETAEAVDLAVVKFSGLGLALRDGVQRELELTNKCLAMASHWIDRAHEHHARMTDLLPLAEAVSRQEGAQ